MQASVRAKVHFDNLPHDICSPFFDEEGNLHFILQDSGDIMMINQSSLTEKIHSTNGNPSGASYSSNGTLFISDYGQAAILALQPDGTQEFVVGVYEDKPLKGPSNVKCDNVGNIYFTDSGPYGETGLHAPFGSLFVITSSASGQILKPLSLETLASPSCMAISPNGKFM